MKTKVLAKQLLNAVWLEDEEQLQMALAAGANPNWVFNGYPILQHAIFTRNQVLVKELIDAGASNLAEGLGFALDRGIGEMVEVFAYAGIVPKLVKAPKKFGYFPMRYCPMHMQKLIH